jgi:hypothetical protein
MAEALGHGGGVAAELDRDGLALSQGVERSGLQIRGHRCEPRSFRVNFSSATEAELRLRQRAQHRAQLGRRVGAEAGLEFPLRLSPALDGRAQPRSGLRQVQLLAAPIAIARPDLDQPLTLEVTIRIEAERGH